MTLLSSLSNTLVRSAANPIALTAGTEYFQRHLIHSVTRPKADDAFDATKKAIIQAGRRYVRKGMDAKNIIVEQCADDLLSAPSTVFVPAYDELVALSLLQAAEGDTPLKIVLVVKPGDLPMKNLAHDLRAKGLPVATIQPEAVAYALREMLPSGDRVLMLCGAEALLSTGGFIAPMGTRQAADLCTGRGRRVFCLAQTFKIATGLPLAGKLDEVLGQKVVSFDGDEDGCASEKKAEPMDITPPTLIETYITERGFLTTAAIAEESFRLWA